MSKGKIVAVDFFCSQTKKKYQAGDVYDGDRTDLGALLKSEKSTEKGTQEAQDAPKKKK